MPWVAASKPGRRTGRETYTRCKGSSMPLEFLREIETGTLPRQVTETGDIDLLRLLSAAGMVEADLPDVEGSGTATVRRITGLGRAWLAAGRSSAATSAPSSGPLA